MLGEWADPNPHLLVRYSSQCTWCSVTDFLQQVHVRVEANAQGEDGDLLNSIGFVDRLNNLLLDLCVATSGTTVRQQDHGGQGIVRHRPGQPDFPVKLNAAKYGSGQIRHVGRMSFETIDKGYCRIEDVSGEGKGEVVVVSLLRPPLCHPFVKDDQVEKKIFVQK